MIRIGLFIFTIGLICCGKQERSNVVSLTEWDSLVTDSLVADDTVDFYSISKVYGNYENNRLLLPSHTQEIIELFMSAGKETEGQPYGEGDCHGKIRRFVLHSDTLAIDKHNCGERGFGNTVFLIKKGSLKLIVTYLFHRQNQIKSWTDILEIAEFKNNELIIQTSTRTIIDWNNLKLNEPPESTQHLLGKDASSEYEYYYNKYKGMYH